MEGWPCRVLRGGVILGVITHYPADTDGCCELGEIDPSPGFDAVRGLFEQEERLLSELVAAGSGSAAEAKLLAAVAEVQRAIVGPGVQMVRLDDGQVYEVSELHAVGLRVSWR